LREVEPRDPSRLFETTRLEECILGARKRPSWILWVLMGFGLLSALAFLARGHWLPEFLNTSDVKAFLCRQISAATGLEATVGSVELSPWNWLEIRGRSLVLRRPAQREAAAEVPLVRLRLGWREALRGRLSVYSVSLEGLEVSLSGEKPVGWEGGGGPPLLKGLLQLARHIVLHNARLVWDDGKAELLLHKGDIWPSSEEKRVVFQAKGEIRGEGEKWGDFKGRGHATPEGFVRLVLESDRMPISPLVHRLLPSVPSLEVQGSGSFSLQIEGGCGGGRFAGSGRIQGLMLRWPGILGIPFEAAQATGSFAGQWSGEGRVESHVKVEAGGFGLKGSISKAQEGMHGVVSASRFDFQEVIPYLGVGLIGHHLHAFFREDLSGGVSPRTTFSWSLEPAAAGGEQRLKLLMEMDFEGVSMTFDRELPPLKDLEGRLSWEGDRVWFEGLRGTYKGHRFRSMEAEITEVGRVSALDARFSLDLGPKELLDLFHRVSSDGKAIGAFPQMEGTCALDLRLRKAFLRDEPLSYSARVGLRDVVASFPELGEALRFVGGELEVSPERLEARDVQGRAADSWWTVTGRLDGWSGEKGRVELGGRGEVGGMDLARLISPVSDDLRLTQGPAGVAFSFHGDLAAPEIQVAVDLSNLGMAYGRHWDKPPGERMVLRGLLHRSPQGAWRLVEGSLESGGGRLNGEGWIDPSPEGNASFLFSASRYPLDAMVRFVPELRDKFRGGAIDLKGEIFLGSRAHWIALVRPRDVEVSRDVLGEALRILSGDVVLTTGWGVVEGLEVEALGRRYGITGRFRPEGPGFTVEARIRGQDLNLDPWLFPAPADSSVEEISPGPSLRLKRWIEAFPSSRVDFDFGAVKFLDLLFQDLHGRLGTRDGRIVLEEAAGTLEGGEVAFEGSLDGDGEFWVGGGVDRAKAGAVFSALGFQEELIEGPLHLQGGVSGQLKGKRAGRHRGLIELEVDKGVIRRFPLLANILSLMNLTQILTGRLPDLSGEGMVFSKIKGSFTLLDGVARTEDFRIYSEAMGFTMVGDIDVGRKACDLKVGVRPFVGFDRLVNQIPVIRHYLAGPEKSVFTTYFLVKGPLADPQVSAIPFRSLGEGMVGIFKRFLENPFQDLGIPYGLEAPPVDEPGSQ
jgi:hypothetical protein